VLAATESTKGVISVLFQIENMKLPLNHRFNGIPENDDGRI
jgi:hypothetical protein